jgi:hypothetical protein
MVRESRPGEPLRPRSGYARQRLLYGLIIPNRLNQARVIVLPAQHIDRFDAGHMRRKSFGADRNSSTAAFPVSQASKSSRLSRTGMGSMAV